jgi:putative ABC transport system permease protein
MAWVATSLHRLRADGVPTAGLLLLVFATSLVAAMTPRILAGLADDAVRRQVSAAPAAARNIVLTRDEVLGSGPAGDPLSAVHAQGSELARTFPPAVRRLVGSSDAQVESGRFRVDTATTDPAFVRLRIQDGVADHVRYVRGRPPTGAVEKRDHVGPGAQDGVPVYEAGISTATADRLGIALGEVVPLVGDASDPLIGRTPGGAYAFARITGIYEVPDPAADFWLGDQLPVHPVIRALSAEVQLLDAVLLVDSASHATMAGAADALGRPLRYSWRSFVDPARISGATVPGLLTAFRQLAVRYPSANVTAHAATAMRGSPLLILEDFRAAWASAESILAVMAVGPALVSIGTLALVAVLAGRRRRATMALARGRGASARQILGATLAEALLLTIPAAILAVATAGLVAGVGAARLSAGAAAAVVAIAVAVIVVTIIPVARGHGGQQGSRNGAAVRGGRRRLVLEILLVVLAAGGVWLIRQRGVHGAGPAGALDGFDPLLAGVPALVGIAAGIVAVRLLAPPMRLAAAVGNRRRGLVTLLAARRATAGGASAALVLVLLATSTVGSFAAISLDNLDRGSDLAAWQSVGGNFRLQPPSGALPGAVAPASLPGVEAAASAFQATVPLGLSGPPTLFAAVEASRLRQVLAGTPVEPAWPADFEDPGAGPIPALVSQGLVDDPRGVRAGDTFTMSVEGYTLTYRVAAVVGSFPGMPDAKEFVVVPREWFTAQAPAARIAPTVAYLRAPPAAAGGLRDAVEAVAPTVAVTSQAEDAAARRAAPVTGAVRALILASALLTVAFAALGAAAALALAALSRSDETARLRTLGLTNRQSSALLVLEHGPSTLLALLAGVVLGAGLFVLVRPAVGLDTLVGASVDTPVVLEPAALALVMLSMAAVVGVGLLLGAALQRRVAPTAAIRGGFA